MRAHVSDARKGEAIYLLALTLLLFLLAMVQNVMWAATQSMPAGSPSVVAVYWIGQLLAAALCFGVGVVGFRPGVFVRFDESALVVEQAGSTWVVPHTHIERVTTIPMLTFHRHYRRYARTRAFIGAPESHVVLIETREAPLVLGLQAEAREVLVGMLTRARRPVESEPVAVV